MNEKHHARGSYCVLRLGPPGGSHVPISQVKPLRLKDVCGWLGSQDVNLGLTAQPVLVSSLLPPSGPQMALPTLPPPPHPSPTSLPIKCLPAHLWHGPGLPEGLR